MEKVAIIGMGTSGMAVLAAYGKEADINNFEFYCFDKEDSFGRGFPYRMDSDNLIVNLKTRKISYDYQNNDDFANWHLENNKKEIDYPTRSTFGKYTKDRLEETIKKTKANKIFEKVVRIDKVEDKWELETEGGKIDLYNRIHLCNGELNQKPQYNLLGNKNYINDIFPLEKNLSSINKEASVVIIGMGLTGVDVALELINKNMGNKIYMFSRTSVIPTVRVAPCNLEISVLTMERLNEELNKNYGRISFETFDNLFLEELKAININYEDFLKSHMQGGIEGIIYNIENPDDLSRVQAILPIMNLVFNRVWDSMTKEDRIKMKAKYHPFLCLNRSPLPLDSAKVLISAFKEGKLEVIRNVDEVKAEDGKFTLISQGKPIKENIDYGINATGLDTHLNDKCINDLILQLINKRYLMKDENGGIMMVPETMAAISPRFGTLHNFHVYGVLATGNQYRNNSTLIIQNTAHRVVKKLVEG